MAKKGSEGLDIIFSMYGTPSRSFIKIWAPLTQKCSVLSEYSQELMWKMSKNFAFEGITRGNSCMITPQELKKHRILKNSNHFYDHIWKKVIIMTKK